MNPIKKSHYAIMKKNIITLLVLLAVTPLLVQCASQNDIKNLNYQIRIVNKKVDDMKLQTVDQIQLRQASSSSQLDQLREEVLVLKGQVDELTHFNRMLKEQNKEFQTSLTSYSSRMQTELEKEREAFSAQQEQKENKIRLLEQRLSENQRMLSTIQQSRLEEARRKADEAAIAAERARKRVSDGPSSVIAAEKTKKKFTNNYQPANTQNEPAAVSGQSSPPSSSLIEAADAAYANGKFQQAYTLYEKYATANPDSEKAVTARFMMGECLFFQKDYNQAILQYQQIISMNPNHPRTASALLKQGMSFENTSEFETAKMIYNKIITSYPSTPEAEKASERSNKIQ